ncbi:MAG: RNA polymerase sigma factor [Novosphingobium sp.]|nr:RNA polymerase sigma factor [Novosphingobium sp.]
MTEFGLMQLYEERRLELQRFLRSRGLSQDDAEDLLQDLYIKIQTSNFGPVSQPRAYLYRMANNMAHDRRRAEKRRKNLADGWAASQKQSDGMPATGDSAEDIVMARDHLQRIEAELEQLPERTSDIVKRFRISGESQKAIANSLGISLSAVEKHLQRGYRAILDARQRFESEPEAFTFHEGKGGRDG